MNRATTLTGLAGGLVALLSLAPATGTALEDLARARAARAEAAALAARPSTPAPPLLAARLRLPGGAKAAIARIRSLAAAGGVLVEQTDILSSQGGVIRLRVKLSGADKAVIALIDRIERDAPLIRFDSWQLQALGEAEVRLTGEAVAA
ncbi:hypothetical protein [Sphingomonas turrisvirgatae]|uniref:NolW-like domain-containing protein n=1 Tax=Sphingomonas turrisvirgatae TaxID=1888892 RepID=A0A1E3M2X7_9SPHN|nr:hypothetical protein [Sphingomonas turrisvirgatae]ODP39420.1 hypothetical protein BFL28_10100 [Sphingomonas turrisvirgatae]